MLREIVLMSFWNSNSPLSLCFLDFCHAVFLKVNDTFLNTVVAFSLLTMLHLFCLCVCVCARRFAVHVGIAADACVNAMRVRMRMRVRARHINHEIGGAGGDTLAHAQNGYTALILAAVNGRAGCARLLLDAGADKEAKDEVRRVGLRLGIFVWGAVED